MNKSERIILRITNQEKYQIRQRAKTYDYTISEFLLECGLSGKVQPILSINLHQWNRLAGLTANLNQLVRLCNAGKATPGLVPKLEEIHALVVAIRHDLVTKQEERK